MALLLATICLPFVKNAAWWPTLTRFGIFSDFSSEKNTEIVWFHKKQLIKIKIYSLCTIFMCQFSSNFLENFNNRNISLCHCQCEHLHGVEINHTFQKTSVAIRTVKMILISNLTVSTVIVSL